MPDYLLNEIKKNNVYNSTNNLIRKNDITNTTKDIATNSCFKSDKYIKSSLSSGSKKDLVKTESSSNNSPLISNNLFSHGKNRSYDFTNKTLKTVFNPIRDNIEKVTKKSTFASKVNPETPKKVYKLTENVSNSVKNSPKNLFIETFNSEADYNNDNYNNSNKVTQSPMNNANNTNNAKNINNTNLSHSYSNSNYNSQTPKANTSTNLNFITNTDYQKRSKFYEDISNTFNNNKNNNDIDIDNDNEDNKPYTLNKNHSTSLFKGVDMSNMIISPNYNINYNNYNNNNRHNIIYSQFSPKNNNNNNFIQKNIENVNNLGKDNKSFSLNKYKNMINNKIGLYSPKPISPFIENNINNKKGIGFGYKLSHSVTNRKAKPILYLPIINMNK